MSVVAMIKNIKQIHKKDIVFVKLGKFYYCYGRDSYIISYFCDYKLNVVEDTYSCGFPTSSLSKVISKLENKKINYVIIDRRNNYQIDEKEDYKNLICYDKYYKQAKEKIGKKLRINRINNYLQDNSNKEGFLELLIQIEEILQKYKFKEKNNDYKN